MWSARKNKSGKLKECLITFDKNCKEKYIDFNAPKKVQEAKMLFCKHFGDFWI
jgi:hypothetical protein